MSKPTIDRRHEKKQIKAGATELKEEELKKIQGGVSSKTNEAGRPGVGEPLQGWMGDLFGDTTST